MSFNSAASLPAFIGCDFGLVLGFEIREGISREIPQATIEGVDGVLGSPSEVPAVPQTAH